uniref:Transposase n=1 Tax=Elaeophora elaphi TaxID=1147741 RepID=A0A0R3RHF4_9BILA
MVALAVQIASNGVSTSGVLYARNPVFTMHLSPPLEWTYHEGETYKKPAKQLKVLKETKQTNIDDIH